MLFFVRKFCATLHTTEIPHKTWFFNSNMTTFFYMTMASLFL